MKKFKLSIQGVMIASLMLVAFLCSCTDESNQNQDKAGDGETVVILSLDVPATTTRGLSSNEEDKINTVEVLVFKSGKYLETKTGNKIDATTVQVNLTRSTGTSDTYDLVILANSNSIVSASGLLTTDDKDDALMKLTKSQSNKWPATTATHTGFPMSSDPQTLTGLVINESLDLTTSPTTLYRMVARVKIALDGTALTNFDLKSVYVYNRNTEGYLKPVFSAHTPLPLVSANYTLNAKSTRSEGPLIYNGSEITTDNIPGSSKGIACTNEIYLFEADNTVGPFTFPVRPCLVIGGKYDDDEEITYYRIEFKDDTGYLNILRNHSYNFTINTVTGSGYDTYDEAYRSLPNRMVYDVVAWSDEEIDASVGPNRRLNVSDVKAVVTTLTDKRIYFWSDQPSVVVDDKGYSSETASWSSNTSYTVSDVFEGLGSGGSNIFYDAVKGEGYINIAPRLDYAETNGIYYRSIFINANGLKREIRVAINHVRHPLAYDYVGTFHRMNQVGERVICMRNTGNWKATVEYPSGGNFVLLSASRSLDITLGTNTPGDAENYPVTDGTTSVSGTGNIYLRVGMVSVTASNRYAKITISCPDDAKTTKEIYVRQGEDADYLMEQESATRPLAAKFSPFNSTVLAFMASPITNQNYVSKIQYDKPAEYFTSYPSQAGAIYQWKPKLFSLDGSDVFVFNPVCPILKPTYWVLSETKDLWNSLANAHEICPVGYHRPKDMLVDDTHNSLGVIVDSEMRQSLWSNPQAGMSNSAENSIWGYYADGFFDRREISTQDAYHNVSSPTSNAVSPNNSQVAYFGRLFYNPTNSASLFFPSAGCRNGENGATLGYLSYVDNGYYWSTSSYSDENSWCLQLNSTSAGMNNLKKDYGVSIRCVKN